MYIFDVFHDKIAPIFFEQNVAINEARRQCHKAAIPLIEEFMLTMPFKKHDYIISKKQEIIKVKRFGVSITQKSFSISVLGSICTPCYRRIPITIVGEAMRWKQRNILLENATAYLPAKYVVFRPYETRKSKAPKITGDPIPIP